MKPNKKGFTYPQIMIFMVICGILAMMAISAKNHIMGVGCVVDDNGNFLDANGNVVANRNLCAQEIIVRPDTQSGKFLDDAAKAAYIDKHTLADSDKNLAKYTDYVRDVQIRGPKNSLPAAQHDIDGDGVVSTTGDYNDLQALNINKRGNVDKVEIVVEVYHRKADGTTIPLITVSSADEQNSLTAGTTTTKYTLPIVRDTETLRIERSR